MFLHILADAPSQFMSGLELGKYLILLVTSCPPDFVSVEESSPPIGSLTLTYWLLQPHWLVSQVWGWSSPHSSLLRVPRAPLNHREL